MRLFKLYANESDWIAKQDEVKDFLNLPIGTTLNYCDPENPEQVENPASSDFEKYLFPVVQNNQWSCIELFDASELVPWNDEWNLPVQ